MELIKSENIVYRYPTSNVNNLNNINFSIEKGKLYAIIGKNGSGKTTLCNLLRGFIPNFHKGELHGNLTLEEKDIREWSMDELAKKIGFIFENPFTQISGVRDTVFSEIGYGLENLGVEVNEIEKKVTSVIKMLGIEDLKYKNPFELSGGQKQRVAFASIIAMDPEILIIDEPTSQLDPKGTEEIFNIIKILKEQGKTIILVEHKLELIAEHSDYIFVMNESEIILKGTAEEVLTNKEILEYGCGLPQYSLLGIELNKRYPEYSFVPTTKAKAKTSLSSLLKERDE